MRIPLGDMTAGDILDRGLKLTFARLPAFYLINLIVMFPVMLFQIAAPFIGEAIGQNMAGANPMDPTVVLVGLGLVLGAVVLVVLLQPLGNAAILHTIMEEYKGNRVGIGEAFSYALSRFAPLLVASIVVGLAVAVGTIFCCIPGIYLAVIYAFIGQVVVLERLGVGDALSRSQSLVGGYWWRVFGVLLLVGIVIFVVQFAIALVLGMAMPAREIVQGPNGLEVKFNPLNHVVTTIFSQLVSIVFTTYLAVCVTLLYLDIRVRKDGYEDELADLRDEGNDYDDRPRRRRRRDDDYDDEDDDYDRLR